MRRVKTLPAETIEDKKKAVKFYIEETDRLQKKKRKRSNLVSLIMVLILVAFAINGVLIYRDESKVVHIPVTVNDISVENKTLPLRNYDVSSSISDTKNNIAQYKVTINGDASLWNKQDTNYYVNTLKSIETEIYELKCTNNQKYKYSFLIPNTIVFRRYSVKGEKPFSEADEEFYKELAAKYFTYKKYAFFAYDDREDYYVDIDTTNLLKDWLKR